MGKPYWTPTVGTLGTVEELTEQNYNKVGSAEDSFTQLTNGIVVGSLRPPSGG
jgi:hypothetical protein